MSGAQEKGGYAYPRQDDIMYHGETGMTLRDYFAGQALAGFCSNFNGSNADPSWFEQHGAPNAYKVADAMLEVRK
tara:strand:+ start:395 stop:619 length:225 start_codon:yes stop_codon:yes gene_type:complete